MNPQADASHRVWHGHPYGMFLVAFTELWERFSYWGLAGLLVLFLTATTSAGGWGWDLSTAVKFYGWYGGMAFALPVVGAWLANNLLGERRGILWGGMAIMSGHLMLAVSLFGPQILRFASITKTNQWFEVLAVRPTFMLGLLLIVLGTGLLKPAISSIVARLYPESGVRRDEGFAYFFVGIYIGSLLGALVAGGLGERFGWHYGFGAAAVGMAAGLACYLAKQGSWLGDIGRAPGKRSESPGRTLTLVEKQRIAVIGVQGIFTVLYAVGFYQMFGMLNLYARDELNRGVGTFVVPTTWMQTVNLWAFFVFVPTLAWLWRRLSLQRSNPSASYKLAFGLGALAMGYLILVGVEDLRGDAKPYFLWLVATYVMFGLGDALVWANQISLTSKLAPPHYASFLVGGWYVCIGLGTVLTGYVGSLVAGHSYRYAFVALAVGCGGAAAVLACLTPILKIYMHGVEE